MISRPYSEVAERLASREKARHPGRRQGRAEKAVVALAAGLFIYVALTALDTWLLMLALGVLASQTGWPVAVGAHVSLTLVIIARLLSPWRQGNSKG